MLVAVESRLVIDISPTNVLEDMRFPEPVPPQSYSFLLLWLSMHSSPLDTALFISEAFYQFKLGLCSQGLI